MSAHDDDRPVDDDLDGAERALAARLATVLAGRAGTVVLAEEAFDPTRPAILDVADVADDAASRGGAAAPLGRRSGGSFDTTNGDGAAAALEPVPITQEGRVSRGWVVWVAGAAAAAVLVVAIVMVNRARDPEVFAGDPEPAPVLVGPDAVWVPSWTPEDLQLWDVLAIGADPNRSSRSGSPEPTTQLLVDGDGDGAAILLSADADLPVSDGVPLAVRGVTGSVREPLQVTPGTSPMSFGADRTIITWREGGVVVSATLRSIAVGEAVAVLDDLMLRDPTDPLAGFAPPSDRSWELVGEQLASAPTSPTPTTAYFLYDDSAPADDGPALGVQTTSATSNATHYLESVFSGTVSEAGVATTTRQFRPGDATTEAVWPDGRSVSVAGVRASDATLVDRVVDGVVPSDLERARALKAEASGRLASAAVLASADLPSGRVELFGEGEPTAICLTPSSGVRSCTARFAMSTEDIVIGSATEGASWTVFVAAREPVVLRAEGTAPDDVPSFNDPLSTSPSSTPMIPEVGEDRGWTFSLIEVSPGSDSVSLSSGERGSSLERLLI